MIKQLQESFKFTHVNLYLTFLLTLGKGFHINPNFVVLETEAVAYLPVWDDNVTNFTVGGRLTYSCRPAGWQQSIVDCPRYRAPEVTRSSKRKRQYNINL